MKVKHIKDLPGFLTYNGYKTLEDVMFIEEPYDKGDLFVFEDRGVRSVYEVSVSHRDRCVIEIMVKDRVEN